MFLLTNTIVLLVRRSDIMTLMRKFDRIISHLSYGHPSKRRAWKQDLPLRAICPSSIWLFYKFFMYLFIIFLTVLSEKYYTKQQPCKDYNKHCEWTIYCGIGILSTNYVNHDWISLLVFCYWFTTSFTTLS